MLAELPPGEFGKAEEGPNDDGGTDGRRTLSPSARAWEKRPFSTAPMLSTLNGGSGKSCRSRPRNELAPAGRKVAGDGVAAGYSISMARRLWPNLAYPRQNPPKRRWSPICRPRNSKT